jgi:hypothetical protein
MTDKPILGISSCLLGKNARYDGGHALDRYLADTLGRHVSWVPISPSAWRDEHDGGPRSCNAKSWAALSSSPARPAPG